MRRPQELTMTRWAKVAAKDAAKKAAIESNEMFATIIKTTEALIMLDKSDLYNNNEITKELAV